MGHDPQGCALRVEAPWDSRFCRRLTNLHFSNSPAKARSKSCAWFSPTLTPHPVKNLHTDIQPSARAPILPQCEGGELRIDAARTLEELSIVLNAPFDVHQKVHWRVGDGYTSKQ
jgi:hypothetical protein